MTDNSIEISIKGRWVSVPAVNIGGKTIVVTGKFIKRAAIHDEAWLATEVENPESFLEMLKAQRGPGLRADIFTFSQKLPTTPPKHRYNMEWESVAAVRVTSFKDWWEGLPQETRKNVRRSQKRGVTVRVRECCDEVIRGLVELNNDAPTRQGRPNRHYGKTFDQVKRDYSSFLDRSDLVCAYFDDELIGLLKVVYRGEVASILQCLPKTSHYDKRPSNALIAKTVELCEEKGITYLTYGMFRYGNRRDSPLLQFKVRNGFEETLVPRFYVPLTRWGAICVRFGLFRGLRGILPSSVIAAVVGARTTWHNVRASTNWLGLRALRPNSDRRADMSVDSSSKN
jgi:hypothetical protein